MTDLRFDDMLATLLAQPLPNAAARAAVWRQVVDVLAQGRGFRAEDRFVNAPRAIDAYNFLRTLRHEIPVNVRLAAGRSLGGRHVPPELVQLFAEDLPHIAAPLLSNVLLDGEQWLALLPKLSPSARNIVRHRRDLHSTVEQALASLGSSDFLIESSVEAETALADPEAMLAPEIELNLAEAPDIFVPAAPPAEDPAPAIRPANDVDTDQADGVTGAPASADIAPPVAMVEMEPVEQQRAEAVLADGDSQIRELLQRIASFRKQHPPSAPAIVRAAEPVRDNQAPIDQFRFETGADGVILWVQGAPREPLIGETIAVAAHESDHGVDGHAAGAFRGRAPFRDARLTIAGVGPASGEWRISAVPVFDTADGRFTGYRGTARRPRPDETAITPMVESLLVPEMLHSDSLRQLVHELRTPINAIVGFSEMIERQYRGPASAAYRARAAEIIEQSRRLLNAVDDLDLAARLDKEGVAAAREGIDVAGVLTRLHSDFEDVAKARLSALTFRIDRDLPKVIADGSTVERMISRLLAATIAISMPGEQILVELRRDIKNARKVQLAINRPRALKDRDERMLLDPGYNLDGDWPEAPVLGLGFALRLVRSLAAAAGGSLAIEDRHFVLYLPVNIAKAQTGTTDG